VLVALHTTICVASSATTETSTLALHDALPISLNPGGYSNPDTDRRAREGLSATEQSERAPAYQALSQVVADDATQIVVCNATNTYIYDDSVSGLQPTLTGLFDFRGVTVSA